MKPLSPAGVVIVSWVGFFGCLLLIRNVAPDEFRLGDFSIFWSAAVVAGAGGNPYDIDQTSAVMTPAGFWNPPFTLPVYLPLGLLDVWPARWVWTALNLGGALGAAAVLWREYGGAAVRTGVPVVLTLTFYGQYWNLLMAHALGLELLGLAGFLYFLRRDRPAAAGVCASLTALKPQLLLIFALWLILGATRRQGLVVLIAGGLTILAALVVAEVVTPGVTRHYLDVHQRPSEENHKAMTDIVSGAPGYNLRKVVSSVDDPSTFWVQFVPAAAVGVFALGYWLVRRRSWDWTEELPVAVWLSALATPYGFWACDQALLLIPVLQVAARLVARGGRVTRWGLGVLYTVVTIELNTTFRATHHFGWVALLTLAGYTAAMWFTRDRGPVTAPTLAPERK